MKSPTTFRRAAVFAAFAFAIVAATSVSALERDATYYTAPADKPLTTEVSSAQLEELRAQINSLQDFFAQHPSVASTHITETGTKKYRRAFHAKGFCLRGTLKVNTGLPTDLKHGVFAAEERTYPVWVRWSNGLGSVNHDVLSDVRGMAVKVFVNGGETSAAPTLDLLSTNSPVPTTNTLQALVDFQRAMQHDGFFGDTKRIVDSAKYFHSHPETLKSLLSSVLSPLRSFAREQFWSGSPYQVGSAQVKFNFEPVKSANAEPTDGDSNRLLDLSGEVKVATLANEDGVLRGLRVWRDVLVRLEALITERALNKDYLLNDMRERVAKRDLVYKVQLQRFVDETKTPINDLFDEWTETEAPSVPVATLTISRQAWDPALQVACENAQFNPSHGVLGHKPLGFLNHGRMSAYASSGNYRNKKNGVPLASPQSGVPPSVGGSASTAAAAPTAAAPTAATRVK